MSQERDPSSLSPEKKRWLLSRIRQEAKKDIKELELILSSMDKVTDKPGKQFIQILGETEFLSLSRALGLAYQEGRKYEIKQRPNVYELMIKLTKFNIDYDEDKIVNNPDYYKKMNEIYMRTVFDKSKLI